MNLQQMILEVRRVVDEPTADFFTDLEITDWLNEGAKVMTAEAQPLQTFHQFATVASSATEGQEYLLPPDVDEIFGVSYYKSSNLYQLQPIDFRAIQFAAVTPGTPMNFYVKSQVKLLAPQTSAGITLSQVNSGSPATYGTVIGLYPPPSAAGDTVTVSYFAKHQSMRMPYDTSPIPLEFHRGIIAYATAMAKAKDSAYGEMNDIFLPLFKQFKDRLTEKMVNRGQAMDFPTVKIRDEADWLGGSSVIIVNNGAT